MILLFVAAVVSTFCEGQIIRRLLRLERMASAYASAGFDWSDTLYECRHDDNDEDNADSADKKVECTERI